MLKYSLVKLALQSYWISPAKPLIATSSQALLLAIDPVTSTTTMNRDGKYRAEYLIVTNNVLLMTGVPSFGKDSL